MQSDDKIRARHPRYGWDETRELPLLKGASLLGLEDGTFVLVCDDCRVYNGITGKEPYVKPAEEVDIAKQVNRVMAHKSSTHWRKGPSKPMYTDEQIAIAIKVYLQWKATGRRNWSQRAVEDLETIGVKPYRGEHWTPGQLGSLVNSYMKTDKFKNIKPTQIVTAPAKAGLADLVRSSAETASGRKTSVGSNVRITEKHKHTPVNFGQIIAEQEADKVAAIAAPEPQKEAAVAASTPAPKISFRSMMEPAPSKTIDVGDLPPVVPVQRAAKVTAVVTPVLETPKSDFEFLAELPDGSVMFRYKGSVMAGRQIKSVTTA